MKTETHLTRQAFASQNKKNIYEATKEYTVPYSIYLVYV